MAPLRSLSPLLLLLLWLSPGGANFERVLRTHTGYEPRLVDTEMGWGAIKCLDFQEVSTLFRNETFVPALTTTCELKSHQCITIRAVNSTHHYSFQGCIPQVRAPRLCTEFAYEAAQKNGAEYFYCRAISHERLNVPYWAPLAGRECCCNGDFCNRIENVKTMNSVIPHDQILSPFWRQVHSIYQKMMWLIGLVSMIATLVFWIMICYIIVKPAQKDDDTAWYSAPVARNQLMDDIAEDEDDDIDVVDVIPADAAAVARPVTADLEPSKKKKKDKKGKRGGTKETPGIGDGAVLVVDQTQEITAEDQEKTGNDDGMDKKSDPNKKPSKEETDKEKKKGTEETPPADAEKKTQEEGKKEEKKEEKEEGKQFVLPKAPKKLANGRMAYISMFNENSDYDDDD